MARDGVSPPDSAEDDMQKPALPGPRADSDGAADSHGSETAGAGRNMDESPPPAKPSRFAFRVLLTAAELAALDAVLAASPVRASRTAVLEAAFRRGLPLLGAPAVRSVDATPRTAA